ncbi:MAG: TonB-dependent receptor [Woeseiaceae bacterium]|nr:TonB-dependent receptor [Woeseiaceae bacterium]
MRALSALCLLLGVVAPAVAAADGPYLGRPVAAVIDELRAAGEPFAYSTNLVGPDLAVTVEPDATEPVAIVRQILAPHGLTVRNEAGVWLVVRSDRSAGRGKVLLVVRERDGDEALANARVRVVPDPGPVSEPAPGAFSFSGVAADRYVFIVEAPGYEPVRRVVDVWPGDATVISVGMHAAKPEIETIAVSASRYEILRDLAASRFVLDQRMIGNMPDVGDDPLRVTQRLPGAAASGASARTHFRGGEESEIGIMLNGLRLFDPFHVRDYQSIFSAIDSRAIEGIEVYTGGFPVRFGDRMSGLVLMESLDPLEARHTEIGVSVFNTSVLTAGSGEDSRWLVSGRRGNLDLVINPELGQPSYYDVFTHFEHDFSPDATLSVNALLASDGVRVVLESEPEELERVTSNTRNAQFWIQLENRWTDELTSSFVLAAVSFENRREGLLNDEEKIVASVFDKRQIDQYTLRQDWTWTRSDRHRIQWGLEAGYAKADYDYRNAAEYFELQALYPDQPESSSFAATAAPDGGRYAVYFADRWRVGAGTVLEWGVRWDDQTYTGLESDSQLSPRVNLLRRLGPDTELRLSWGRYHQSQAINELQIEDGVTNFWPAQRADHYIVGLRHLVAEQVALRVELFQKNMRQVRPRFENLFDPLGLIPEIQPDRVRLEPSSARSSGIELSVDYSNGPLNWWATYTFSEATDEIDGRDVPRSWDQPHAFQGGVGWSNEKWDFALAASVHTGWPATGLELVEDGVDDEGEPVFVALPGPRNALRHSTFASLDLRLARTWKLRRGSLMAFVELSNLTNRRNVCCFDYDIEEDEETGEEFLERSLDYWLPLLPAIGVRWEF